MAKKTMQVFAEVISDYTDPETGNVAIDCYLDTNPDSDKCRIVAWITPDGEVIKGTNPEIAEADFQCPLVIEAIEEVKTSQEELKQKLVDDVLWQLEADALRGDSTVLEELLKMIPSKNLIQALPEEKWGNYPIQIK